MTAVVVMMVPDVICVIPHAPVGIMAAFCCSVSVLVPIGRYAYFRITSYLWLSYNTCVLTRSESFLGMHPHIRALQRYARRSFVLVLSRHGKQITYVLEPFDIVHLSRI
jgi:hypothetical protein